MRVRVLSTNSISCSSEMATSRLFRLTMTPASAASSTIEFDRDVVLAGGLWRGFSPMWTKCAEAGNVYVAAYSQPVFECAESG